MWAITNRSSLKCVFVSDASSLSLLPKFVTNCLLQKKIQERPQRRSYLDLWNVICPSQSYETHEWNDKRCNRNNGLGFKQRTVFVTGAIRFQFIRPFFLFSFSVEQKKKGKNKWVNNNHRRMSQWKRETVRTGACKYGTVRLLNATMRIKKLLFYAGPGYEREWKMPVTQENNKAHKLATPSCLEECLKSLRPIKIIETL